VLDTLIRKIGFRRVELIQDPLEGQKGTSFYFKINNKRIFIGGSNWIPIDTDQARGTEAKFRKWIELLVSPSPIFSNFPSWPLYVDVLFTSSSPLLLRTYDQVKGNQNMIRIWGGGFFEPDIFYDLCDEMGVLVWQDCESISPLLHYELIACRT
jgi:beta-mannosidase